MRVRSGGVMQYTSNGPCMYYMCSIQHHLSLSQSLLWSTPEQKGM